MIDTVKKFYQKIDPTNEISWTNEYIVTYLDGTVSTAVSYTHLTLPTSDLV